MEKLGNYECECGYSTSDFWDYVRHRDDCWKLKKKTTRQERLF